MIYAVRTYTVDPACVRVFLAAFRRGGLWTDIARLQPGHIHTDLLRDPSDATRFLSLEFWSSIPALVAARRSFEVRSFLCWLDRQAISYEGLGMYVFPPQTSTESMPDEAEGTLCVAEENPIFESCSSVDEVCS